MLLDDLENGLDCNQLCPSDHQLKRRAAPLCARMFVCGTPCDRAARLESRKAGAMQRNQRARLKLGSKSTILGAEKVVLLRQQFGHRGR
jgi:hypothetical protein